MSDDHLTAAEAAEQRRRIEALQNDPEARAAAASARPRGPAADPTTDTDEAGKAAMLGRFAAMAEHSADPERTAETERRIAESRKRTAGTAPLTPEPNWQELATWTACPPAVRTKVDERLPAVLGNGWELATATDGSRLFAARRLSADEQDSEAAKKLFGDVPPGVVMAVYMTLDQVRDAWRALPEPRPPDPLEVLEAAWQRRPKPATPFMPVKRASLSRLAMLGPDEVNLPDFPEHDAPVPADGQLLFDLPELGQVVRGCTSWLLWLFDKAGAGGKPGPGRGARWDLRLFVYALLHLDVHDRDGEWHTLRFPALREHAKAIHDRTGRRVPSIEEWLHPDRWHNKSRDWHKLPEALHRIHRELSYVPVPGIGSVAMLLPSVIPERPSDPLVEFTIRVPPVAAHGDRLNWPRLVRYGADSDRLVRCYLAVVAWLGRSARRGHPITRTLPAPVLGPNGKPARRKGGRVIRSATEQIDNPAARYAGPPLSEADLTRMIGYNPDQRKLRFQARAAFERMEADKVIEIDRSAGGFLVFGGTDW